jgi:flagellar FliL protein
MMEHATEEAPAPKRKGKKLIVGAAVLLLLGGGGGAAWFFGLIPGLGGKHEATADAGGHGDGHGHVPADGYAAAKPVFVDMPDIVANLNSTGRRSSYIKLRSKLEVANAADAKALQDAMPRLQDMFTTYLREVRPEELRGSAGTWRLREELMVRAGLAAPPAKVSDVLFVELLVQ